MVCVDLGCQTQGPFPYSVFQKEDPTGWHLTVLLSIQVTSFWKTSFEEFIHHGIGLRNNADVTWACVNVLLDLEHKVRLFLADLAYPHDTEG